MGRVSAIVVVLLELGREAVVAMEAAGGGGNYVVHTAS